MKRMDRHDGQLHVPDFLDSPAVMRNIEDTPPDT
jgi:hypothetical protein